MYNEYIAPNISPIISREVLGLIHRNLEVAAKIK